MLQSELESHYTSENLHWREALPYGGHGRSFTNIRTHQSVHTGARIPTCVDHEKSFNNGNDFASTGSTHPGEALWVHPVWQTLRQELCVDQTSQGSPERKAAATLPVFCSSDNPSRKGKADDFRQTS